MRLFVAAYPSPEALADLAAVLDTLHVGRAAAAGVNARVAARELWHVTLAFLGDVPDDRLADATAAVDRAADALDRAADATAALDRAADAVDVADRHPTLRIAGGGTFGRGRFTVLWAGLAGDVDGLRAVSTAVTGALRRARLPFDRKPLRPHLTLARPGGRIPDTDIAADVATLAAYRGPKWTLDGIVLVESHLGPRPTYDARHTVPLSPSRPPPGPAAEGRSVPPPRATSAP